MLFLYYSILFAGIPRMRGDPLDQTLCEHTKVLTQPVDFLPCPPATHDSKGVDNADFPRKYHVYHN